MGNAYAGIGSRETPADVLITMSKLAGRMRELGWILRSGGADGADTAFEKGAGSRKEIFLPWKGFNKNKSSLFEPEGPLSLVDPAVVIAEESHPNWSFLTGPVRKMMTRNVRQVLGVTVDDSVKFVVCWTPDGCESKETRQRSTGGTAQAIVIAANRNIPVFNLKNPGRLLDLKRFLLDGGYLPVM